MKNKEQIPHGFCVTPEQNCTMNYCDENGCQNRKRTYVINSEFKSNKPKKVVDAYCPTCDAYLCNERLTFGECCDTCLTPVEYHEQKH
jgi:hypothetical protein